MTSTLPTRSRTAAALSCLAVVAALAVLLPTPAGAAEYVPGQVVVGYAPGAGAKLSADIATRIGARAATPQPVADEQILRLPRGVSVAQAISRLRRKPGVLYAVPNFIAHMAGSIPGWIPNDPGRSQARAGWEALQWNFLPAAGVNAPVAWMHLIGDHRPGGRGVVVAVLDTGVAYRDWRQYRQSPDFKGTRFTAPYDFVANNRFPLDRVGHGTFVTGTVAEATNNGFGVTGLAYGATIMPVRILDADGSGDSGTISRGIRYAVMHGAQVINLSLEFTPDVTTADIPDILNAVAFAHRRGVVVVAAAGNEASSQLAYPARARTVISVGATTRDLCLAEYSNNGAGLDLVAPGGGTDTTSLADPNCHPTRSLPAISQISLLDQADPRRFGIPFGIVGTSMSTPHVAATAALVIASGVIGRHPSPDQILSRLEATARPLGGSTPNLAYGYGLVDAGAATAR